MSSLPASLISQTIDDHIAWLTAWSRVACFETAEHDTQAEAIVPPESFAVWRKEAAKSLLDQPPVKQLIDQFDQLHRGAKMAVMKTPEGQTIARHDYVAVAMKYQEFMNSLRRMERALSTAAAGLDTLTGLRSRTGMRDDLSREMGRFRRNARPFCLAMMDIDHFKKINDQYGHENGDRVLEAVANHITRVLRSFDDAWRWGGEEFLLCLKDADLESGKLALERVRASLEKMPITLSGERTIYVTASFGLSAVDKESTIDGMIAEADKALYRAKEKGRNRVEAGSTAPAA